MTAKKLPNTTESSSEQIAIQTDPQPPSPHTISLSNLQIGRIYKNYRELCNALNASPVSGKQKILQMQRWKNYFSYETEGRSFIITDIFSSTSRHKNLTEPVYYQLIKTDPYTPFNYRKSKYTYYLVPILVFLLSNYKASHFTYSDLFYKLGVVNKRYTYLKYNQKSTEEDNKTTGNWIVNNFYKMSFFTIYPILKTALDSMKDKRILEYSIDETVHRKTEHGVFQLSEPEMEEYNTIKSQLLLDRSFNHSLQEFYYMKSKEYKDQLCNQLINRGMELEELLISKIIRINLLIKDNVPTLSKEVIQCYKTKLNQNIRSVIHSHILKDYNKNKEQNDVYYGDNYLSIIDNLIQTYITIT